MSLHTMIDALDAVVREQLWQVGRPFEFFAEFAIALPPTGLGVRSLPPLKMLRYALLANGNFAHWTDLLERTAREPGRPRQKLVFRTKTSFPLQEAQVGSLQMHWPGLLSHANLCNDRLRLQSS